MTLARARIAKLQPSISPQTRMHLSSEWQKFTSADHSIDDQSMQRCSLSVTLRVDHLITTGERVFDLVNVAGICAI